MEPGHCRTPRHDGMFDLLDHAMDQQDIALFLRPAADPLERRIVAAPAIRQSAGSASQACGRSPPTARHRPAIRGCGLAAPAWRSTADQVHGATETDRRCGQPAPGSTNGAGGRECSWHGHVLPVIDALLADGGVVQIRVIPKPRDPINTKALSISGDTWKWHFLNHAPANPHEFSRLGYLSGCCEARSGRAWPIADWPLRTRHLGKADIAASSLRYDSEPHVSPC